MQVHIQQSDSGAQQTPPHAPFQTESGPLCAENLTQPWSDTSVRFWTEPAAVDLQNWRVDLMDSPPLSLALYLRTSGNSVGFASHMLILTSHLVNRLIQSTVLLLLCWSDSRPYFLKKIFHAMITKFIFAYVNKQYLSCLHLAAVYIVSFVVVLLFWPVWHNTTFCCISHTMKLKLLIYIILSYSAHNCPITDESVTCNAAILLNSTHPMADFFFSVYPLIFHAFSLTQGGVWSQSPVNCRTPHTEKQKNPPIHKHLQTI